MVQDEISLLKDFIGRHLKKNINHGVGRDSFESWSTFCWWLPTIVDIRRYKALLDNLNDTNQLFLDANHDTMAHQVSKIILYKESNYLLLGLDPPL